MCGLLSQKAVCASWQLADVASFSLATSPIRAMPRLSRGLLVGLSRERAQPGATLTRLRRAPSDHGGAGSSRRGLLAGPARRLHRGAPRGAVIDATVHRRAILMSVLLSLRLRMRHGEDTRAASRAGTAETCRFLAGETHGRCCGGSSSTARDRGCGLRDHARGTEPGDRSYSI